MKVRESSISRRNFMAGTGLAIAGLTGGALIGCTPADKGASRTGDMGGTAEGGKNAFGLDESVWKLDEIGEPTETIDADVCIIGGGGTGMAATIQGAELGLDVVLLEKGSNLGGAFSATEGMFGVESHWQKEAGGGGTVGEAVRRCVNYHHYIPSTQLYYNFFSQTAETIEWCEEHDCRFRAVVDYGGNLAWHVYYYDENASSPGAYFTDSLIKATEKTSAKIITDCIAKKILMEDGKAAGVLAEANDGTVYQVNAPVVMLASGGFPSNMEFLHAISPYTVNKNLVSLGAPGRDGDGLRMGVDAGVMLSEGYGSVMWCGPAAIGALWATDAYSASVQPTLWVNQDAKRFIAEDLWIGNFAAGGIACRDQELTYVIFREKDLAAWEQNGPYGTVFTFGTPGVAMDKAREQLKGLSSVHAADTLEELAKSVGLDPKALKETVDEYNKFCSDGSDPIFGKATEYLTPIDEGPFWILEVADGYYTTVGGLEINENLEAVDWNRKAIPGLYVGGCDTGSLYGDSYDVATAPGSQASWAINSGRLAMKNAATYLGK